MSPTIEAVMKRPRTRCLRSSLYVKTTVGWTIRPTCRDDLRYAGLAFTRVEYFIHDVFGNIYYLLLESFKCNIGKIANWFSKRVRKRQEKS